MNDKTKKKDIGKILGAAALKGSLNKAELKKLREVKKLKELRKIFKDLGKKATKAVKVEDDFSAKPLTKKQIKEGTELRKEALVGKYKGGLMVKPKAAKRGY